MQFYHLPSVILTCTILCLVDSRGIAGNVKLVAMNGNQYWFSSSSPYAPQLNFHLAYQYCRTLGLQLVVLETKEEVDTIASYLNTEGSNSKIDFWTSGNKLGADSWIWMSSGEQLNHTFAESWLVKQAPGAEAPKQCMSMRATNLKRTVFTPEECDRSLPFVCEQVRCLYYNYPVQQFPDPNANAEATALRAEIEEGSGSAPSESRARLTYAPGETLRSQHFISGRNVNSLRDQVEEEGRKSSIDPNTIQRRITLRPVINNYPPSPDYINSFYRYQSVDYSATSTNRPTFKKTTRQSLWNPTEKSSGNDSTTPTSVPIQTQSNSNNNNNNTPITSSSEKNIVYITSTTLPSNATIRTSTTSSLSKEHRSLSNRRAPAEVVTVRSRSQENVVTEIQVDTPSTIMFNIGNETDSTDPSAIVFDDEANNVGGEVFSDSTLSDQILDTTTYIPTSTPEASLGRYGIGSIERGSQDAVMKMYQFQRSKSPVNWSSNKSTRSSSNNSGGGGGSKNNAPNAGGPAKIGLGPRLKFRRSRN